MTRAQWRSTLTATTANQLARWAHWPDGDLHKLSSLVRAGDVCMDVGSSVGLYYQALSHLVGPQGLVHSVEPLPFTHPFWSRLLGTHNRRGDHHHQVALGPEPGRAVMRVPYRAKRADSGRSFLDWKTIGLGSNADYAYHVDVPVDVETLDRLCRRANLTRLDFVKIDVEGGELHVLHGGQEVIETLQPTMLVEIEERHTARYGYTPDEVVQWLTTRGYAMYAWRHGWQPVDGVCLHENNYLFRPVDGPADHSSPRD